MFKLDRELGFVSFSVFNFCIMLVWGWRGNIYSEDYVLRINIVDVGIHRCIVEFVNASRHTTTLHVYRWLRPWTWKFHSEWIAVRWGTFQESDGPGVPDVYAFRSRLLGNHFYF